MKISFDLNGLCAVLPKHVQVRFDIVRPCLTLPHTRLSKFGRRQMASRPRKRHNPARIKCPNCDKWLRNRTGLTNHQRTAHWQDRAHFNPPTPSPPPPSLDLADSACHDGSVPQAHSPQSVVNADRDDFPMHDTETQHVNDNSDALDADMHRDNMDSQITTPTCNTTT